MQDLIHERMSGGDAMQDALHIGGAMQRVQSQFCTAIAVQKPRSLASVQKRLLEEARLAGEEFYYGWAAGGERIEGPAVGLALAAARCYGNCAVDMLPMQETAESWIFAAVFVDLETGFTITRQFRQSKNWKVHGKLDDERKADVRFQIGQSKAIRNVVLNAVPKGLIRVAMDEAKKGVREKIEAYIEKNGVAAAVDLVFKSLGKCGVPEARVLLKMGVADKKGIGIDHLVILRGDISAIENGQERASDLFPVEESAGRAADKLAEANGRKEERPANPGGDIQMQPKGQPAKVDEASPASEMQLASIRAECQRTGTSPKEVGNLLKSVGAKSVEKLTAEQAEKILLSLGELADVREPGGDDE